jgi:ABC-type transport system involved in multi-copper enzyme maturation permease subunit
MDWVILLFIIFGMKNIVKVWAFLAVSAHASAVSAINVKSTQTTSAGDNGTGGDIVGILDNILAYLIGLLYFVAVVFALYGGFQILTAGGDEEKVKKGKTTLIQAVIGLIVIFLASNIISWIIDLGTQAGAGGAIT